MENGRTVNPSSVWTSQVRFLAAGYGRLAQLVEQLVEIRCVPVRIGDRPFFVVKGVFRDAIVAI